MKKIKIVSIVSAFLICLLFPSSLQFIFSTEVSINNSTGIKEIILTPNLSSKQSDKNIDANNDNSIDILDLIRYKKKILDSPDLTDINNIPSLSRIFTGSCSINKVPLSSSFILDGKIVLVESLRFSKNTLSLSYADLCSSEPAFISKNITGTDYFVYQNKLYIFNGSEYELNIFNNDLEIENTFSLSFLKNYRYYSIFFIHGNSDDSLYIYVNDLEKIHLFKLSIKNTEFTYHEYKDFSKGYSETNAVNIVCDKYFLMNCRPEGSLKYQKMLFDTETEEMITIPFITYNIDCFESSSSSILARANENYLVSSDSLLNNPVYYKVNKYSGFTMYGDDLFTLVSEYPSPVNQYQKIYEIGLYKTGGINTALLKIAAPADANNSIILQRQPNSDDFYIYMKKPNYITDILLWDTSECDAGNDLYSCSDCYADMETGSIPELAELYKKAAETGNKHNINIYIGDTVHNIDDAFITDPITDSELISSGLDLLDRQLDIYPENFFDQLLYDNVTGIDLYFFKDLTPKDTEKNIYAAALVKREITRYIIAMDLKQFIDDPMIIHHELSHRIDKVLEYKNEMGSIEYISEDKWNSFNPEGFEYSNTYLKSSEDNIRFKSMHYENYFYRPYSMSFSTEDRADIFGKFAVKYYFSDYDKSIAVSLRNIPMINKLKYYCEIIRNGFDTTGWADVMPWEKLVFDSEKYIVQQ